MLEVKEISLANIERIYQYKQTLDYEISFDIKGFDYGWILSSREWKPEDKVLDVGGAYSPFPSYLSQNFGCETWVADDYGIDVNDPFWLRNQSPHKHIEAHPENRYVLERVGNPETSSLPTGYFDVIYSASALEHVSSELTLDVWRHMNDLLTPQGELIHAIDILFPSNGGFNKMFQKSLFDSTPWLFPQKVRHNHYLATPRNYSRIVCSALDVKNPPLSDLDIWNMCLNPDILTESLRYGWNRITKGDVEDYSFQRVGSLLLHFVKS